MSNSKLVSALRHCVDIMKVEDVKRSGITGRRVLENAQELLREHDNESKTQTFGRRGEVTVIEY